MIGSVELQLNREGAQDGLPTEWAQCPYDEKNCRPETDITKADAGLNCSNESTAARKKLKYVRQ